MRAEDPARKGAIIAADDRAGPDGRATSWLVSIVCVLLLMWPALVNRGPFYFSDTSSYVRAGDVVARILVGERARTIWTRDGDSPTHRVAAGTARGAPQPRGNEPDQGYVMSGRSPYFGLLLWLSWVASRFWLFILAQAVISYALIRLSLRTFDLDRQDIRLGVVAAMSVLTPLAIYNGVLLADALSGFGIAALLLLAAPTARLSRRETGFLFLLLVLSVISHLTHLVIAAGMTAALAFAWWLRWVDRTAAKRAIVAGVAAVVLGVVSLVATSIAIERHYGKPPVLVPLLTARFVADGPGRDFIAAGCGGRDFMVCRIRQNGWTSSTEFLWSRDPAAGAFLTSSVDQRRALSQEDKAFAIAVAKAYPIRTAGLAVWNTLLQIGDVRNQILMGHCFTDVACIGDQFPQEILRGNAGTLAGRTLWPVQQLDVVTYVTAIVTIVALLVLIPALRRRDPAMMRVLALWVGLVVVAMVINGFLGGAISEPQSRYQARMAWLIPFLAALALLRLRMTREAQS